MEQQQQHYETYIKDASDIEDNARTHGPDLGVGTGGRSRGGGKKVPRSGRGKGGRWGKDRKANVVVNDDNCVSALTLNDSQVYFDLLSSVVPLEMDKVVDEYNTDVCIDTADTRRRRRERGRYNASPSSSLPASFPGPAADRIAINGDGDTRSSSSSGSSRRGTSDSGLDALDLRLHGDVNDGEEGMHGSACLNARVVLQVARELGIAPIMSVQQFLGKTKNTHSGSSIGQRRAGDHEIGEDKGGYGKKTGGTRGRDAMSSSSSTAASATKAKEGRKNVKVTANAANKNLVSRKALHLVLLGTHVCTLETCTFCEVPKAGFH